MFATNWSSLALQDLLVTSFLQLNDNKHSEQETCHELFDMFNPQQAFCFLGVGLRTQFALKERNLKVRNITWIFSPEAQLKCMGTVSMYIVVNNF